MKALIYRDFITLRKSLSLFLAMTVFIGIFTLTQGKLHLLPMVLVLGPVIFLGSLFALDAQDKLDQYIIPAPLSRKQIVLSRYVMVWMVAGIGAALSLLLMLTVEAARVDLPWYLIVPVMFLLFSIFSIIQLPLMYRFGAEKARLIFMLLYFVIFGSFLLLGRNKEIIAKLLQSVAQMDHKLLSLLILAATVLLNGISFAVSVAIYERKEF